MKDGTIYQRGLHEISPSEAPHWMLPKPIINWPPPQRYAYIHTATNRHFSTVTFFKRVFENEQNPIDHVPMNPDHVPRNAYILFENKLRLFAGNFEPFTHQTHWFKSRNRIFITVPEGPNYIYSASLQELFP